MIYVIQMLIAWAQVKLVEHVAAYLENSTEAAPSKGWDITKGHGTGWNTSHALRDITVTNGDHLVEP